jgi:hypothetical protein
MVMEGFNSISLQEETENFVRVNESLKRSGLGFTSSLDLMNGRLSKIDKEAEPLPTPQYEQES